MRLPPYTYRAGTNNTETVVVVAVVRVVVVPVSNRAVRGVVVPRATAFDAVIARRSAGSTVTFFFEVFL